MRLNKFIVGLGIILFVPWMGLPQKAVAQGGPDKVLKLWSEGPSNASGTSDLDTPTLSVFLPAKSAPTQTAVVVFPGGGYSHLAMDHEGYQVAEWLNSLGIAAFVVKYRLGMRYHHPSQINDAHRAIRMVRARADHWQINPERIGILGFSAGGHLASTAGTHFLEGQPNAEDPLKRVDTRPDFMILIYPVITMKKDFTHKGSRNHLLGKQADPELVTYLSNEMQVTGQTPPTFLVHGTNDLAVPVQNSLQFYEALLEHDVPAEMHLFEDGPHGFGLGPDDPQLSQWPGLCKHWMQGRGLLPG